MKKKWRINEEKVLRNILVVSTLIALGLLAHKIGTNGIAWLSTMGYFG